MKPIWIELVNNGVANRFEFEDREVIEMNWRLTLYPDLYARVYKHEIEHQDGTYKIRDFWHDMKSTTPGLFGFMRNHISSWTQLLPFYWDKEKHVLVYDISSLVGWLMVGLISTTIFFLMGWSP